MFARIRGRPLLCALALTCCAASSRAQEGGGDTWRWRRFDEGHGLPSKQIDRVLETQDGTPWALTAGGLARFDGHRWTVAPNPEQAPVHLATSVCTKDGHVVFVADGELWSANESGIRRLPAPPAEEQLEAFSVANWEGRLLLETRPAGRPHEAPALWVREGGGWRTVEPPGALLGGGVPAVRDTGGGAPILQCASGLKRWDGQAWREQMQVNGGIGGELAEGEGGAGLAALRYPHELRGLWAWEGTGPARLLDDEAGRWILAVDVSPSGTAAVAYDSGSLRIRRRDGAWLVLDRPAELGQVRTLAIRGNGDLWLGTGNGLYLRRRSALWVARKSLEWHTNALLRTRTGDLWIATDEGYAILPSSGEAELHDQVLGRRVRAITGLAEDGRGHVWLASGESFEGALRWDGEEWLAFGPQQGLEGVVHRIVTDRRGRPWFCTLEPDREKNVQGRGAFLFADGVFERWDLESGLPSDRVYDLADGPEGELWFATLAGLSRYREGTWRHWSKEAGLHHSRVFAVEVDGQGRAWFAHQSGGGGVGVVDGEEVSYFSAADGLVSDQVWDLDVDPRGWVWATSQSGLSVVRESAIGSLGPETGLPNPRLWPVLAEEDAVWVGSFGDGPLELRLDLIESAPPEVDFPGEVFRASSPVVRWRALAPQGAVPPHRIATRYSVDSGDWSVWGPEREVALAGLSPGQHSIQVQARGLLGDRAEPAVQTFEVPLPILPTGVPVALLSGLVITAGALAYVLHGRRRLTAELREGQRLLSELVENALDLIYTCDVDGRLTSLNPAAVEALGYAREEVLGRPLEDFVVPEHRERLREVSSRALTGRGPAIYELEVVSRDGSHVGLEVSSRGLRRPDRSVAVQSVARDVTRRHELEGQLLQAQKMEAVGQLAGGIAHDFNNMLLVINGYSDLVLEGLSEEDPLRRRVEQIQAAGERATSLTRQLLAFSRKQVLRPERLDLGALIADMGELVRRVLSEDIALVVEVERDVAWVEADPTQLQQVVLNLVVNARDEMPRGGTLSISTHLVGEDVELLVSDTGRGMDEETRARLFEPFFTTKMQGKGTGLGLSTVYGIVEQSGGRIEVESERGQGATFRIRLPLAPRAVGPALPVVPGPGGGAPEAERKADVVLVVEDEPEVRGWMGDVLADEGYEVLVAADADEALRTAEGRRGRVHLLVTDVVMPGMSGPALARALAAVRPDMKVLYVSGYTGEALLSRGGRESGLHFLQKPFRRAAFLEKVRQILAAAREERLRTGVSRR